MLVSNGREYNPDLNPDDCLPKPEACATYDVVVTPDGTIWQIYLNFVNAISKQEEHLFFGTEDAKKLFPYLYEEPWLEALILAKDPDTKFIETRSNKGKYFYHCVDEELNPEEFKAGMEYFTLVVQIEK